MSKELLRKVSRGGICCYPLGTQKGNIVQCISSMLALTNLINTFTSKTMINYCSKRATRCKNFVRIIWLLAARVLPRWDFTAAVHWTRCWHTRMQGGVFHSSCAWLCFSFHFLPLPMLNHFRQFLKVSKRPLRN